MADIEDVKEKGKNIIDKAENKVEKWKEKGEKGGSREIEYEDNDDHRHDSAFLSS